jgi:hypothetical protein
MRADEHSYELIEVVVINIEFIMSVIAQDGDDAAQRPRTEMTDQDIMSLHAGLFDISGDVTTTQLMFGFQGVGPGWLTIMERLCSRLMPIVGPEFKFTSVKEKVGCLRIAFRGGSDAIGEAVDAAKAKAMVTCDQCGAAGSLLEMDRLWAVRCGKCAVGSV